MKLYTEIVKDLKIINAEIESTILMPVMKGTKVKVYENRIKGLIEKVRKLSSNKNLILDELDLLFAEDETKFDRVQHLWLTAFRTAFEQVCFNFQDGSLSHDTVNNNTKLFRSFMQVKAKVDYDENLNIKIEELGIYYAYTLNNLQEIIEKRALELKHPIKYFYTFSYHAVINTDHSTMGKRNYIKLLHIFNDNSFQTQIKETEPLQIKDKLEFHLRNYQRNGGTKINWIIHTKSLIPPNLTPEQKDAFLTWIENNERQENKNIWDQRNLAAIRNHNDHVMVNIAKNEASEETRLKIENEIMQKKELNISEWKNLIKHELHGRLEEIETKIKAEISNWKERKSLIQCAAFCQLLFDNKYFVSKSTNRKSVNSFALNKYGTDITIQLKSAKKIERESHKLLLKKHFK